MQYREAKINIQLGKLFENVESTSDGLFLHICEPIIPFVPSEDKKRQKKTMTTKKMSRTLC